MAGESFPEANPGLGLVLARSLPQTRPRFSQAQDYCSLPPVSMVLWLPKRSGAGADLLFKVCGFSGGLARHHDSEVIIAMSRLRRPFLCDCYIFVSVKLLPSRAKLETRDYERLAARPIDIPIRGGAGNSRPTR